MREKTGVFAKIRKVSGFTIVELLVAAVMLSIISLAAFQFYGREHQVYSVQEEIVNAQQNARIALDELAINVMSAGADLPAGFAPVISYDADPDTIVIRYNKNGCFITVGDHTQIQQSRPIHTHDTVTCFDVSVGQQIYLLHNNPSPGEPSGEWFTLTGTSYNNGNGWQEISHLEDLLGEPKPGDVVLVLEEAKYYIDSTSSDTARAHPRLMKIRNGQAPQIYAEDIVDLQFVYFLGGAAPDTVDDIEAAGRNARDIQNVRITVQSRTQKRDPHWPTDGGFRLRTLNSEVHLRNLNLL
ncbi:MAG: prepilin-type N-terminal cleavage/methylation domain-containing protein [candidate division Zixibacteria bacterium]|nr:prepilin-type N-terminal cleavage/methylation domain-containing protein [candidate division Zixibacteria bacterium]